MKDFTVESSQENTPCLEEAPSDSVVSDIVSPSEIQSSECSEQEMEEWVNLLKWSHFTAKNVKATALCYLKIFPRNRFFSMGALVHSDVLTWTHTLIMEQRAWHPQRTSHSISNPSPPPFPTRSHTHPHPPDLVFVLIRHIKLVCVF